ncbi:MAG: hypothetical protein J6V36_03755 [Clostridia bacterium]|nr:hypothetical protein [Clostridia bacterium]
MIENIKTITETEIDENGVCSAPDFLAGTPEENKRVFDKLCRNIIIPKLNAFIEEAVILEKAVSENANLSLGVKSLAESLSKAVGDISTIEASGNNVSEKINTLRGFLVQLINDLTQKVGELDRLDFFATTVVNALNYLYDMITSEAISYAPKLPEPSENNFMKIFRVFDLEDKKHKLYICKVEFPKVTGLSTNAVCGRIYFDPFLVKERFSAFRAKYIDSFSSPSELKQYVDVLSLVSKADKTETASIRIIFSTALDGYALGFYKNGDFTSIWASDNFELDGISYNYGFSGETYTDLGSGFVIENIMPDLSWLLSAESFQSVFYWEELGTNQNAFDVSISKSGRYSTLSFSLGDEVKSVVIEDGINGYSPKKGVDYFTEEEIDLLSSSIEENLRVDIASSIGLKPEFANDISECTDTSKLYVLPDNFIYAYLKKHILHQPNFFDLSNGSQLNIRVNSSNAEVAHNGFAFTGFIDVVPQSPYEMTVKGVTLMNVYDMAIFICVYNSDKNMIGRTVITEKYLEKTDGKYTIDLHSWVFSEYPQTAYIKVGLGLKESTVTLADVENLVINLEPKNYSEYSYVWANTNHSFVPTEYDDVIASLSDSINENKEEIFALKNKAEEDSTLFYHSYWADEVSVAVEKIKEKKRAAGINSVSFAFFSDNHQRLGDSCALVGDVVKKCGIPFAFFCGDSVSSGYIDSKELMIEQEENFAKLTKAIPENRFCRAMGNHDGYYLTSDLEKFYLPWEERCGIFLAPLSTAQNKVFGGDGTYYYVDDIASKTRFIVLNSVWFNYKTNDDGTINNSDYSGFGNEQILWLKDVLLNLPQGYEVAFISHSPISNSDHSSIRDAHIVQGIVNSFIDGSEYQGEYSSAVDPENNCSVSVSYSKKGNVIGWFAWHVHRDLILSADAKTSNPFKFRCVTITSDANLSYDPNEPERDLNGTTGHAIDFVTVNKTTGEVFLTRLGVGNNRSYYYK